MRLKVHIYILLILPMLCMSCGNTKYDGTIVTHKNGLTYHGGMVNGKYEGYGELRQQNRVLYSGEWKHGLRDGHGICIDSLGRRITGIWRADTLVSGMRTDKDTTYIGELDDNGTANGYGIMKYAGGRYYEGFWGNDDKTGMGFAISENGVLKMGEWKGDKFLGERVVYTPERIYGIDISRFQHDKGRKHYPIIWKQVRITNLGKISRKRVNGVVDYPISFCYIKSTEGVTIRNRYYKSDYTQARANGIHCGAYHFFSTKSNPTAQAKYFLKNTYFRTGDLPPVLDLEPYPSQIEKMGGAETMFRNVRIWMKTVHQSTGMKPILYVSQTFVNKYLSQAPDIKRDYNVWIARYGEYKPDVHLAFWQLSPDGNVKGIHGDVDINVFNGYRSEYNNFLRNHSISY